jgi:hypothetical protein
MKKKKIEKWKEEVRIGRRNKNIIKLKMKRGIENRKEKYEEWKWKEELRIERINMKIENEKRNW